MCLFVSRYSAYDGVLCWCSLGKFLIFNTFLSCKQFCMDATISLLPILSFLNDLDVPGQNKQVLPGGGEVFGWFTRFL